MRRTSKLQNIWKTLFEYKFFKLEYDEKPVGIIYMTIKSRVELLKKVNNPLFKVIEDENIKDKNEAKLYAMLNAVYMNGELAGILTNN